MESMAAAARSRGAAGATLQDYAQRRGEIAALLDELSRINEETGQSARAARVREVRDGALGARFSLLVLGEFKRGKSTLINRLLGADVLPVGAAPTTAVLTRITYGEVPSARLVLEDGTEREIDFTRLGEEITLVQTSEGENRKRHAGIVRAEIAVPSPLCLQGVDIVDSPGLGEHTTRSDVTYGALPAADAVVFVADAAQLGSEDEGFIRGRLAREDVTNVFFVINKWDRVFNETEDPEAESQALRRRAWALFVPEPKVGYNGQDLRANRIYPLSTRPNLAPEEYQPLLADLWRAFTSDLDSFLAAESARVALERSLVRARAAMAETQAGLRARGPALAADLQEFERRVAAAEEELRALEGPRQAIRDRIAVRRQAIRQEARTRATRDLPGIETGIKEEFAAYAYRPPRPLGQRILDGMQDSFRREKIREELRGKVREIAAARLEPWATGLSAYVEQQIAALLREVEPEAGAIEATFQRATRILGGLDQPVDSGDADQQDLMRRGIAAGVGILLRDPFLIMSGGMHGFKGLGRTMLYQFAGVVVVSLLGLPVLPVLVATAMIASIQNNDELIDVLKDQVLKEVLDRVQHMRGSGIGEIEALAMEPLDACAVAIEQAIDGRIRDHQETVAALRQQMGQAREHSTQQRAQLDAALSAVAALALRLEAIGLEQ